MSEDQLPLAPDLHGDLLLDVFTHPSLRQGGGSGDNERYTALGEKVLEAAVTHCIFIRFPKLLLHKEIADERDKLLSDDRYDQWTNFYRFRERIRYNQSASDEIHSTKGARDIFHAYVGGVYTQANGPNVVNNWVYNLIVPPKDRKGVEDAPMHRLPPPPNDPYPMPPPPPPGALYAPRSRTNSFSSGRHTSMAIDDTSGYNASAPAKVVFLPRFNEICTQRRYNVQYPAEQGGLQHAPRWIVKCLVNGEERGQGSATTKQLAKEEAAKQAWVSLGFGMI